jgi:MtN3 and saliva related transmembrane protein
MPEISPFFIDLVGFIGGASTTVAFIPQVAKTWKTKSADDLSLIMYLVFANGVFCWLLYGLGIGSWPVIIANAVTFVLVLSVLAMKIRYSKSRRTRVLRASP